MNPISCDAIIFDLDGVLVDSTPCLERQMRSWAARHGLDATPVLSLVHGRKTVETIRMAAPHLDAEVEATAIEAAEAAGFSALGAETFLSTGAGLAADALAA